MKRKILCVTLLWCAAGWLGCGANRSVEIPEEPAPMPTMGAETATASSPADTPSAETQDTETK